MKAVKGHVTGVVGALQSVKIALPKTLFKVVPHYEGCQRPCEGGSGNITVSQRPCEGSSGALPLRLFKVVPNYEGCQRPCERGSGNITVSKDSTITDAVHSCSPL